MQATIVINSVAYVKVSFRQALISTLGLLPLLQVMVVFSHTIQSGSNQVFFLLDCFLYPVKRNILCNLH